MIPGIHKAALRAILHHHERWDGSGYPNALEGESIPLEARILSVCDVYDTLLSQRPYSRAWGIDSTLEELRKNSGTQFDPTVIEAFLDRALGKLTFEAPALGIFGFEHVAKKSQDRQKQKEMLAQTQQKGPSLPTV